MSLLDKIKQLQKLKDNPEFRKAVIRRAKKDRSPREKTLMIDIFVVLFFLLFLGAGIGLLINGLSGWTTYLDSETWERVPISIHSLELEEQSGPESGRTWKVQVNYSYNYNGITYRSDNVYIGSGSGDYNYHKSQYNILKQAQDRKQNYLAYVNPQNPQEAILFRYMGANIILLPLFGLVFALVGGISIVGISSFIRESSLKKKLKQFPEAPWLAFNTWKNNRVIHSKLKNTLIVLGGALFMALLSGISMVLIIKANAHLTEIIITGVFLFFNLVLFIYGGHKLLQYFKRGKTCFTFHQVPIRPGETLTGMIVNSKKINSFNGFKACLRCSQEERVSTSGSSSVEQRNLYKKEYLIKEYMQDQYGGTSIPIHIDIPSGFPGTAKPVSDKVSVTTYWQLEITAETPGIDFKETFDLPVFS